MKEVTLSSRKINNVIFDFDGVLADSFGIFVESLEEVLHRKPFSEEQVNRLRGLSPKEIIKELGVRPWQMPGVIKNGHSAVDRRMSSVHLFPGIPTMLRALSENHELYIVSSTSEEAIREKLAEESLTDQISKIYSGTSLFGKSRKLRQLAHTDKLNIANCVYIGDEVRDIEAAQKIGMSCIAVAWGYNTLESLERYQPSAIVYSPTELPDIINSLTA